MRREGVEVHLFENLKLPQADGSGQASRRQANEPTRDDAEAARKLFAGPLRFHLGRDRRSTICRRQTLPEVAFVGRSNAGKSSLINALTGRKSAGARLATRRARTRQINFFNLGGKLMLVDLPGYGYAKRVQDRWPTEWQDADLRLSARPREPAPRGASDRCAARRRWTPISR